VRLAQVTPSGAPKRIPDSSDHVAESPKIHRRARNARTVRIVRMVLVTLPSCRSSALRILWVAAMRSPEQPAPGRSELRTCDCRARGRIQRYPEESDNGPAADVLGTSHSRTREGRHPPSDLSASVASSAMSVTRSGRQHGCDRATESSRSLVITERTVMPCVVSWSCPVRVGRWRI
jgi:hypothetical protein